MAKPPNINWEIYDRAVEDHTANWKQTDDILYRICRECARHTPRSSVNAKVSIIARAYATGIERKIGSTGKQASSLSKLIEIILKNGTEIDEMIQSLPIGDQLSEQDLLQIVEVHGRFGNILEPHTIRKQKTPSFISKYLHFHNSLVPIYDSVACKNITKIVRSKPTLNLSQHTTVRDGNYCWYVSRFWEVYKAVREQRPGATVKQVDSYLLWDPTEKAIQT